MSRLLSDEQRAALQAPIPADVVTQRAQAGQTLDYVEGWWVIDRLNEIIGNGAWGSRLTELSHVCTVEVKDGKQAVTYRAIVHLDGPFETQTGAGFATSTQKSLGDAHEMAGKSAETDALKRAAIKLGRHLGLALYQRADSEGARSHVVGEEAPLVAALDAASTAAELEAAKADARAAYRRMSKAAQVRLFDAIKRADGRVNAAQAAE